MKLSLVPLLFVFSSLSSLAEGQSRPIPPGVRQADQAEAQTERNIPPPAIAHAKLDLAKVSREADELSMMAQTIPTDVALVEKGMLPKDVLQKLKQVEKLAKRLRSELNPRE